MGLHQVPTHAAIKAAAVMGAAVRDYVATLAFRPAMLILHARIRVRRLLLVHVVQDGVGGVVGVSPMADDEVTATC